MEELQSLSVSPLRRSLLDDEDDKDDEIDDNQQQRTAQAQQRSKKTMEEIDDDETTGNHSDDDDDDDESIQMSSIISRSSPADNDHRALAESVLRQVSAVQASKSRVQQAKLGLARGRQAATINNTAAAGAGSDRSRSRVAAISAGPVVLHDTLADDLSSSDDDDHQNNNHETITRLQNQVKLLRQSLHGVHESMIEVEENAALKHAKLELQLEYFKKALADSKAYTAHLQRRNQSLQTLLVESTGDYTNATSVMTTTSPPRPPPPSAEGSAAAAANGDAGATGHDFVAATDASMQSRNSSQARKERLVQRELHTERNLMKLLQERKQLSDANFELQKRVLYWQHLTKQCDSCQDKMQKWKERRAQEKLTKEQQMTDGISKSVSSDMEQVQDEAHKVDNGDEQETQSTRATNSPVTPPTTNKRLLQASNTEAFSRDQKPLSGASDNAKDHGIVGKRLIGSSPSPFSKTKPALKTPAGVPLAGSESVSPLPTTRSSRSPLPPNKRISASRSPPQSRSPRARTPPPYLTVQPRRGILKTSSSNSGTVADSSSPTVSNAAAAQYSLLRNQNSMYISDLQNSTRNVLHNSKNSSSYTAPALAAATLSSNCSMFSNSDESLSASRLELSSSQQQHHQQQSLELSTLAESASSNISEKRHGSDQSSSQFYASQETNESTIPSDGSLLSLQGRPHVVIADTGKLKTSMVTSKTKYNDSTIGLGPMTFASERSGMSSYDANISYSISAPLNSIPPSVVSSNTESLPSQTDVSRGNGAAESQPARLSDAQMAPTKSSFSHRLGWTKKLLQRSSSADTNSQESVDEPLESAASRDSRPKKRWGTKATREREKHAHAEF